MNITISNHFKKQARNAILGIIFFIAFYFFLIAAAVALTFFCFYLGKEILSLKVHFFTIVIGLGIASIGVLILIFLIKFLFKNNTTDLSFYKEITREQEPEVFALIDEIILEVETDFPKKVYLSEQVNASVFYDSSFWSMFLPIKKNLHIGMGLVNSVTKDELKAILSHEFGHFSQKSMKIGSYVYNVNHIIHNLLYDNSSYASLAQKWTDVSGYFVIFVGAAFKIIEGIQWLLQKMYNLVNKKYLALSREMEFHADEVAAHVTGYLPLKTSLLRLNLASNSLDNVFDFYNAKQKEGYVSLNVFKELFFVMRFHAERQKLDLKNQFPEVTISDANSFQKSKLVIENQWASHPETEERIAALEQLNIVKDTTNNEPARNFFKNPDAIEEHFTKQIFESIDYTDPKKLSLEEFSKKFKDYFEKETFHLKFNGYFDQHNPKNFNESESVTDVETFDELFSDEKVALVKELNIDYNDLSIVEGILNKQVSINTFDYEGIKYKSKEAKTVVEQINNSINKNSTLVNTHDRTIYQYFCRKAEEKAKLNDFKFISKRYLDYDALYESNFTLYSRLISEIQFMYEQNENDYIQLMVNRFRPVEEIFKEALQKVLSYIELENEITTENRQKANDFIQRNLLYFNYDHYIDNDTATLFEMIHLFQYLNHRVYFKVKKKWLDQMLEIEGIK